MGCGLNNDSICNWLSLGYRFEVAATVPEYTHALDINYMRVIRGRQNEERGADVFVYGGLGIGGRRNYSTGQSLGGVFSARAGAALSWTNFGQHSLIANHSFRFAMGMGVRTNIGLAESSFALSPEAWVDFSYMTGFGLQIFYHGLNADLTGAPTVGFLARVAFPSPF